MNIHPISHSLGLAVLVLAGCSGGGSQSSSVGTDTTTGCSGDCATGSAFLSAGEVETILSQAISEAKAQNARATIAVVDRVGNVLGTYRMNTGQQNGVLIGDPAIRGGLNGIQFPVAVAPVVIDDQAAIAKAVTGAYLSSEGNAFSTRTANQIVQENFNPGEQNQPAGPLFGVQFSQLACSDFSQPFNGAGPSAGPKRSPLGLSADPGGLPVYKGGTVVGGVGVIADGVYGLDKVITDLDQNLDELIALAGTFGFAAPQDRRADRITVEGKTFRFSDADFEALATDPASAPPFASLIAADGAIIPVNGYFDGTIAAGTAFGTAASGIRADGDVDFPNLDAFVFVDDLNTPRFPPRDATDFAVTGAAGLTAIEVQTILSSALDVANRARAQIRRPLGSSASVTISIVDTLGEVLGMVRTRDAPVFGADVSLQKARTAAFFSSADAASFLQGLPDTKYLETTDTSVGFFDQISIGDYVTAVRAFLADPAALTGSIAFSDRGGGNLSRPFFPDGVSGTPHGPFSKPPGEWSLFSTGLQLDLVNNAILQHVLFVAGVYPVDVGPNCVGIDFQDLATAIPTVTTPRLANGLQIFPGSVPIFRGDVLIGGIGVSGDGVDQDDLIAFLGVHNAGLDLGGAINNAPPERRSDTLTPHGIRLRFVQCPAAPFLGSDEDNVCDGK